MPVIQIEIAVMLQILVSLSASLAQMLSLMAVARLIGTAEYSQYSLGVTIGVFISALTSEWLRMILSRQAGGTRLRVRSQLLQEIRHVMLILVGVVLFISVAASSFVAIIGHENLSGVILGVGILASSNIVADITATYLRFSARQMHFCIFIIFRAVVPGLLTIAAATLMRSGISCLYIFAVANMLIGAVVNFGFWPRSQKPRPFRLLGNFVGAGVAMSTSTVAVTWAVTAVRSTLAVCLPANLSGALFVALDLGQRGFTVLGSAISTWGVRLIYDSAHNRDQQLTTSVFRRVSDISLTLWFSVALYGACGAIIAPSVVARTPLPSSYLLDISLVLMALLILLARIYLVDPLLAALSREREIAIAAAVLAVTTVLSCGAALWFKEAWIAVAATPFIAGVSLLLYWQRNVLAIRQGVSAQTLAYGVKKLCWAILMMGSVEFNITPVVVCLVLLALILDYRQSSNLLRTYRGAARRPIQALM